jgi:diaminohydroxyphosphoribosylaminopyrimidine deaminase/5-amino-6-(5-phosphoribosylamino)uracil reductase
VIFDRRAELPLDSILVKTARTQPVIAVTAGLHADREAELSARGVTILRADSLDHALSALHEKGIGHLLVEGGAGLASAFLSGGRADRLIIFQAPVILGSGALAAFTHVPASTAEGARRLRVVSRAEFGADLMTIYAVSENS